MDKKWVLNTPTAHPGTMSTVGRAAMGSYADYDPYEARGIPVASPVAGGGGYGATNAPIGYATTPPVQQRMSDDPSAGLGFLGAIDGVFLQEKVEMLEVITGCDTHNVYHVTPVPKGMLPEGVVPKEWIEYFTRQAHATPMLKAREEGECLERICCPNFRSFSMDFKDGTGATFFTLHRPFNCTIATPCFMCNPQRMSLVDARGVHAAHAAEEFRMCWWCTRSFVAKDEDMNPLYRVRAGDCATVNGKCNWCAPSCCNESYDVDVLDPGEQIPTRIGAYAGNVWPGWTCAGITDRSNILIRFPPDSTPKQRASLLATMMLVEFSHFEWKKGEHEGNLAYAL